MSASGKETAMKRLFLSALALLSMLLVPAASGQSVPVPQVPALQVPAGRMQQYIVVLNRKPEALPDVAALFGGKLDFQHPDILVVTLPESAAEALRKHSRVKYLQRVVYGPPPAVRAAGSAGAEAASSARSEAPPAADGSVNSSSVRLVPRSLTDSTWDYVYDGAGNITKIGSQMYTYDTAQRLAQSTTGTIVERYTYDGFGNRTAVEHDSITTNVSVNPANNRLNATGMGYDVAGSLTAEPSANYTYDPDGQVLKKVMTSTANFPEYYVYTASGERVGMRVKTDATWYWSLRDEGGHILRQYHSYGTNLAPVWVEDFVWRDGLLLGSQRPVEEGGRSHFHLDHLGTPRLVTSDAGQTVSQHDYYPFGAEQTSVTQETASGFDREQPLKFTGHERDFAGDFGAEDGNAVDYMHARYYNPTQGRFLSPDPILGDPEDPQSWNRYSYVRNNPIRYTDPTGLADDGDKKWDVWGVMVEGYEFAEGAANGWSSSFLYNANRVEPRSEAYAAGQATGSAVAAVNAVQEATSGLNLAIGGGAVTLLSGGAASAVSVPAAVVGATMVVHGTTSAVVAIDNTISAMSSIGGRNGGGGKTGRKINQDRADVAQKKIEELKVAKTKAKTNAERREIQRQIDHQRLKLRESEEHARVKQGNR
jgi:RHS repeat-associated protein